jgi:hypothetical protein
MSNSIMHTKYIICGLNKEGFRNPGLARARSTGQKKRMIFPRSSACELILGGLEFG